MAYLPRGFPEGLGKGSRVGFARASDVPESPEEAVCRLIFFFVLKITCPSLPEKCASFSFFPSPLYQNLFISFHPFPHQSRFLPPRSADFHPQSPFPLDITWTDFSLMFEIVGFTSRRSFPCVITFGWFQWCVGFYSVLELHPLVLAL